MLLMSTRQSLRSPVVVEGEEVVEEEAVGLAVAEGNEVVLVTAVAEVAISSYYRRKQAGEAQKRAKTNWSANISFAGYAIGKETNR